MNDAKAKSDPILRILDALIQRGITTPRAELTPEEILSAVEQFRPDQPVWPHTGTGYYRRERRLSQ